MLTEAPFELDLLAADAKAVQEREDGDLVIRGLASDIGLDRQDEAFEPGAFQKAIANFLGGQASLLYHHQNDFQIGQVTGLEQTPNGLEFTAVVPRPTDAKALDIYTKIKRGMMKAVSVRGRFKRRKGPDGLPRIYEADLHEISVTPLPVNPRTLFAVAAKAFEAGPSEAEQAAIREYLTARTDELAARVEALSQ